MSKQFATKCYPQNLWIKKVIHAALVGTFTQLWSAIYAALVGTHYIYTNINKYIKPNSYSTTIVDKNKKYFLRRSAHLSIFSPTINHCSPIGMFCLQDNLGEKDDSLNTK